MADLTVGFDLDMTLIDPRPGMVLAMDEVRRRTGFPVDGERFASNLGPPLDGYFRGCGLDEEQILVGVREFRALYPEIVIPRTVGLPGAAESLAAVRAAGGSAVVVTGKYGPNAQLHLDALDWEVDHLVGELWSTEKAVALRRFGAKVYVGDHIGDVNGARAAGAFSVAVPSGPCTAQELLAAGADLVLDSLTEFPRWLAGSAAVLAGLPEHRENTERETDRQQQTGQVQPQG